MKTILLIVGGGIAAYKSCELIRLLRKRNYSVRCVLTAGGSHFVTEMALAALSENQVYTSLWDLKDEVEMGHIQLSRQADLIVVAPATADLLARMAGGLADDLATTVLLATDKPVLAVPAMNVRMWDHPATRRNVEQLRGDGIAVIDPHEGWMACGEYGPGRLPEPGTIVDAIESLLGENNRLTGRHVIVTAGPTHEPIDPVRYFANRSSGRQGFAIAGALRRLGARVTLISGPVQLTTPQGIVRVDVETARQMAEAVHSALPADVAVMVAAVADWRVQPAPSKLKKTQGGPVLTFEENPDILATVAAASDRPQLLIGFAAETDSLLDNARMKLEQKRADWIVANDVSGDVMGGNENSVHLVTQDNVESWERLSKDLVATRLADRIADALDAV